MASPFEVNSGREAINRIPAVLTRDTRSQGNYWMPSARRETKDDPHRETRLPKPSPSQKVEAHHLRELVGSIDDLDAALTNAEAHAFEIKGDMDRGAAVFQSLAQEIQNELSTA